MKVKGVFVKLDALVKQIQSDHSKRLQTKVDEPFPLHIGKSDPQFVHSQILFDCLVHMKSLATDQSEFLQLAEKQYGDDLRELDALKNFREEYSSHQAIWWYTRDCALSRIFTKALSEKNLDLIFQSGFFIRDLYDTLQKNRLHTTTQLFHGQILSMNELLQLKNSTGGYFILNRFLSANLHRHKVIDALQDFSIHNDLVRVLFEIEADPKQNQNKPFANITPFTFTANEQVVLFMIGSIFRIASIQQEKKSHLWIVKIAFSNLGKDYNACNVVSCGQLLLERCNAVDQAEKYFLRLAKETPQTHLDMYFISHALAHIYFHQFHYELSLQWYQQALSVATFHKIHLGRTLFYLGCTFQKIGQHQNALDVYESALNHWENQPRPDEAALVGDCWNNFGCVLETEEYFGKALECHQRARTIREELNGNLGSTYNNIANVYLAIGEYAAALEHYQFALEAKKKIVSPRDETIGTTLANMALVCELTCNWTEASHFYTAAASIFAELYSPVHMYNINMRENLTRVCSMVHFQSSDLHSETVV